MNIAEESLHVKMELSVDQLEALQSHFDLNQNPNSEEVHLIAEIASLDENVVEKWFDNCRLNQCDPIKVVPDCILKTTSIFATPDEKAEVKREIETIIPITSKVNMMNSTSLPNSVIEFPSDCLKCDEQNSLLSSNINNKNSPSSKDFVVNESCDIHTQSESNMPFESVKIEQVIFKVESVEHGELESDGNDTCSDNIPSEIECETSKLVNSSKDPELIRQKDEKSMTNIYVCEICNKCFSRSYNLKVHMRKHSGEKAFACDVCNKNFANPSWVTIHRRMHTGEKPFSCKICNKNFVSSSDLRYHNMKHTGERPFVCDICNMGFYRSGHLRDHKSRHRGEKTYACDVCSKTFSRSCHLLEHKRVHTGEKPFVCAICKKRFTGTSTLIRHKRTHREKPFPCDSCNKVFSDSSALMVHKRVHTVKKLFACGVCKKKFTRCHSLTLHHKKSRCKGGPPLK